VTSTGTGYELLVIAAAVIGGTSFAGGIGTIPGPSGGGAHAVTQVRHGHHRRRLADAGRRDRSVLVFAVGLDTVLQRRSK
jgi:D-xylose transport system permease protein